jgi:hypothetical protein
MELEGSGLDIIETFFRHFPVGTDNNHKRPQDNPCPVLDSNRTPFVKYPTKIKYSSFPNFVQSGGSLAGRYIAISGNIEPMKFAGPLTGSLYQFI